MRVEMYAPDKLYGFCAEGDVQVFFHAEVFERGHWPGVPESPGPLIGEQVTVDYRPTGDERAPRATRVVRIDPPVRLQGVVETFNAESGWGFARGEDAVSYYLHRSEVEDHRLPVVGQALVFFAGRKKDRPRACYAKLGLMTG